MKEEDNNITTEINNNVPDASSLNPYAKQKITSKKLEIVENFKPKEKEKESLPVTFKIIVLLVILTGLLILFFKIIYPTYFQKTYDDDYACKHPYRCTDNGNGTSTCSFYDNNDKLQTIICNFSTESEETTTAVPSEGESTTTTETTTEVTTTTSVIEETITTTVAINE